MLFAIFSLLGNAWFLQLPVGKIHAGLVSWQGGKAICRAVGWSCTQESRWIYKCKCQAKMAATGKAGALIFRKKRQLGGRSRRFAASCAACGSLSCSTPGSFRSCFWLCVPVQQGFHFCPCFTSHRFCFRPKLQRQLFFFSLKFRQNVRPASAGTSPLVSCRLSAQCCLNVC